MFPPQSDPEFATVPNSVFTPDSTAPSSPNPASPSEPRADAEPAKTTQAEVSAEPKDIKPDSAVPGSSEKDKEPAPTCSVALLLAKKVKEEKQKASSDCCKLPEKTCAVPLMLAKKVAKEKSEKAKVASPCSCAGQSNGKGSGEAAAQTSADEDSTLEPTIKETLVKGTDLTDEKFTKEIFDAQGRLLWQRVVIGGPGPGKTVKEKHFDENGSVIKCNYSPGKSGVKQKAGESVAECGPGDLDKEAQFDGEKSRKPSKKSVQFTSEILPTESASDTGPSASVPTKKPKKSILAKAPETSENETNTRTSGKPMSIIPKSAREFVTSILQFVGELEDTTIKSNRLREKNVLNEYRGLVQLFLLSQAGFLLAFMILGIVLLNVFALLFVVVLYASR